MTKAKRGEPLAWIKANAAYQGDDCLVWPFGQSYGYGNVRWNGRTIASHRLMCLMVHETISRLGLIGLGCLKYPNG